MPDIPETNKREPKLPTEDARQRAVPYAELHCKTNFSFLEGASHADELVVHAAELGYRALAITDAHSLAGVVRAHGAAKEVGLKLLIGAEVRPTDVPPVVLWWTDRAAYGRLSRLITVGRRRAEKGDCRLTFEDVAGLAEGLIAGVVLLGMRNGECGMGNAQAVGNRISFHIPHSNIPHSDLARYRDVFSDRCYALAELYCGPSDERRLAEWIEMAKQAGVP